MKLFKLQLFLQILLVSFTAYSQVPNIQDYLPGTQAASLGEYGDIPLSLFSGRVAVSIPLAEMTDGVHKIPVTLDYSGGGIKVDQYPSSTGLGWVLNVGGCITRQVRGSFPDEYSRRNAKYGLGDFSTTGYFYHGNYFGSSFNNEDLKSRVQSAADCSMFIDYEPDRFTFNFLDYHGNFYIDGPTECRVQCDRSIKVEFDVHDESNYTMLFNEGKDYRNTNGMVDGISFDYGRSWSIKGFTIIGDDGTRYVFGGDENAIEFSSPIQNQWMAQVTATSWYLTRIEYVDGRVAEFTYSRPKNEYQLQVNRHEGNYYQKTSDGKFRAGGSSLYATGSVIFPVYLKKITLGEEVLSFGFDEPTKTFGRQLRWGQQWHSLMWVSQAIERDNNRMFLPILCNADESMIVGKNQFSTCLSCVKWRPLRRLIHSSSNGSRSHQFYYSNDSTQRLTLDSIAVGPYLAEHQGPKYKFEYNNPKGLPQYCEGYNDMWGYASFMPSIDDNGIKFRPVDTNACKYGALTKIIYPTGGYSRFEYEPNDYIQYVVDDRRFCVDTPQKRNEYAGGIRIKRIFKSPTLDENDELLTNEFEYIFSRRSSGVLLQPVKRHFKINDLVDKEGQHYSYECASSESVLAFDINLQPCAVGYSKVKETLSDGSYLLHYFTNYDNGYPDRPAAYSIQSTTVYTPYTSLDQDRGHEYKTEEYTPEGTLTRRILTDFEYDQKGKNDSLCVVSGSLYNFSTRGMCLARNGSAYTIHTHLMHPFRRVISDFDNNGRCRTSTTAFCYDENRMLKADTTDFGGKRKFITTWLRPQQFASVSGEKVYSLMKKANRLSPVIETKKEVEVNGERILISAERQEYADTNIVYPQMLKKASADGDYRLEVSYDYDDAGHVIYEYHEDGLTKSYFWARPRATTNHLRLVGIGESGGAPISPGWLSSVSDNAPVISESMYEMIKNSFRNNGMSTAIKVILFRYDDSGNISSIEDSRGVRKYYTYDIMGRVITVGDNHNRICEVFNYNYPE